MINSDQIRYGGGRVGGGGSGGGGGAFLETFCILGTNCHKMSVKRKLSPIENALGDILRLASSGGS